MLLALALLKNVAVCSLHWRVHHAFILHPSRYNLSWKNYFLQCTPYIL